MYVSFFYSLTLSSICSWFYIALCPKPILTQEDIINQNFTCLPISPANATSKTPTQPCCWTLFPTSGIKLRLIKLSPKDVVSISEVNPNTWKIIPLWQGNQTCSDGIHKCPFQMDTVLFSNQTGILRTFEMQLDPAMQEHRIINLDIISEHGE